jgi:methionyl-tRNA synthetase
MKDFQRVLVTCAWPYIYTIPHLGNLIGSVLSADVIARYHRLKGKEVVFVSGSDEHGTPIEVEAIRQNKHPKDLTDENHAIVKKLFEEWWISFDNYTRTENEYHKKFVREFYYKLYKNGYLFKKQVIQPFCENCNRYLPDRFILGTCPYCGYEKARGDQCEECGNLLEPTQLINPKCAICGNKPINKITEHFFIDFPKLRDKVIKYIQENAYFDKRIKTISLNYIKDEFKARALTRDNKWGIPAPFEGYENKTIYVWFEAVLGYISATIEYFKGNDEWKKFWFDNNTLTYYFIGKDNIPFHSIIFPALLMATGEKYNLPHIISATEFLTFEGKKFSKSQGIGIWIDEALKILDVDYWRYYLIYIRPEERDTEFTINNFVEIVNSHLNDTLGNFIYRVTSFIKNNFNYTIPEPRDLQEEEIKVINLRNELVNKVDKALSEVKLREALNFAMEIAREGNRYLNERKPWEAIKSDVKLAANIIYTASQLINSLSVVLFPFIPKTSLKIRKQLNLNEKFDWNEAFKEIKNIKINEPEILFRKISAEFILKRLEEIRSS